MLPHYSIQSLLWLPTSTEPTIRSNPYFKYALLQNPLFDPILTLITHFFRTQNNPHFYYPLIQNPLFDQILTLVTQFYRTHYSIQSLLWFPTSTKPTIRSNPDFGEPLLQTQYSIHSLPWLSTYSEPTIRSNPYFVTNLFRTHYSIQSWLSWTFSKDPIIDPFLTLVTPLFDPILTFVTNFFKTHYSIQSLFLLLTSTERTILSIPYFGYPLLIDTFVCYSRTSDIRIIHILPQIYTSFHCEVSTWFASIFTHPLIGLTHLNIVSFLWDMGKPRWPRSDAAVRGA